MRPKGSAEELERRRRRAVELCRQGLSQVDAARAVGSSQSSVSRWLKMASVDGSGLAARHHPGAERRLSNDAHRQLVILLGRGARAHGWSNNSWTASRVRELIQRYFGVTYHRDHVRRILVERLGWSPQLAGGDGGHRETARGPGRRSYIPFKKKRRRAAKAAP